MVPTAVILLGAWEAGAAEAPLDRAPSLLARLGAIPPDRSVDDLTVGECDARLFALRRTLFGDRWEAVSTCPGCGDEVELDLSLADLQPPVAEPARDPVTVRQAGGEMTVRLPRNDDLRSLHATRSASPLAELVERCLIRATRADGTTISAEELTDEELATVAAAMAEHDPGAQTVLAVRCSCGAEWADELDIRAVLWTDLTDWVGRTLTDVHRLARAYGWSESEILAMPAWRRRWYLEAVES